MLEVEGVGALDGESESSGPNLGGHDAESARDSKHDGVVVVLGKTVMHEEGTRAAIDIRPGVLDLSGSSKALGDHFVVGLDELYKAVILDVLVDVVELAHEAGIGLSKDGVSITGDDLARLEGVGNMLSDIILGPAFSVLVHEGKQEVEALLIGESVEGSSKTVHAG